LSTEPSLDSELRRVFHSGSRVIVDLAEGEFIDSTVLRAILYGRAEAADHEEHSIAIVAPQGRVARRLTWPVSTPSWPFPKHDPRRPAPSHERQGDIQHDLLPEGFPSRMRGVPAARPDRQPRHLPPSFHARHGRKHRADWISA
jgi:hypothetical protein